MRQLIYSGSYLYIKKQKYKFLPFMTDTLLFHVVLYDSLLSYHNFKQNSIKIIGNCDRIISL